MLAAASCVGRTGNGPSGGGVGPSSPSAATTPSPAATPAPSPTPIPSATPVSTPSPDPGLSYNQDLKPIFDNDCVGCHSASNPIAGYSMATYAGVLRDVRPGDPNCTLVSITRPNEVMYANFSGDRAAKAAKVYDWVVKYKAAQNR